MVFLNQRPASLIAISITLLCCISSSIIADELASTTFKNALFVETPDLAAKYNWLKSPDRDPNMGPLSATNRRVLILAPGEYILTSPLILDQDYVDITALSVNYHDTCIVGDWPSQVIEQTAAIVNLSNFSIYNADTTRGLLALGNASIGLMVNASGGDNSGSTYNNMYFDTANDGMTYVAANLLFSCGVYCKNANESGEWNDCVVTIGSWRSVNNCTFGPTMRNCTAGDWSYAGDGENTGNGYITGKFYNCEGGSYCFGGCGNVGVHISSSAYFEDCTAGHNSFGIGRNVDGTFKRCVGGDYCFGGYKHGSIWYSTFNGYAEDCVATGNSFGMGAPECALSGTLVRCRNGTLESYKTGISGAVVSDFTDATAIDCHPWIPSACDSNTPVYPFDNGHTYTTKDANSDVIFSLPAAVVGLQYTFVVMSDGNNLIIAPDGTDEIFVKGIGQGSGGCVDSNSLGDSITLKCFLNGRWDAIAINGMWSYPYPIGDLSGPNGVPDYRVNMFDLAVLGDHWCECKDPAGCP